MISQFNLPSDHPEYNAYYNGTKPGTAIAPLSQINYFIGPNNSGKSRLLRLLLRDFASYAAPAIPEKNTQMQHLANKKLSLYLIPFECILNLLSPFCEPFNSGIRNIESRNAFASRLNPVKTHLDEFELIDFYNDLHLLLTTINRTDFDKVQVQIDAKERKRQVFVHDLFSGILAAVNSLVPKSMKYHFTYIPSFRTIRRFLKEAEEPGKKIGTFSSKEYQYYERLEQDIFKSRVVFDYFLELERYSHDVAYNKTGYRYILDPNYIFTGESLFSELKKLRNSGEKDRKILTDFEEFLSFSFFESKSVSLNALDINNVKEVYIKIGAESEFAIHHLGDGIQAIILLTFPLFIHRDKQHQIFYEEPELFLHPGMQRVFIDALVKFDKTQAYIATHSNHFLDTSLDYPDHISIFSLKKNLGNEESAKFQIDTLSSPKLSLLNQLGVRNSSVLLANCSIWVEGISDRLYLKKYLEIYQQENPDRLNDRINFKEDLHFCFLEYGGNNIVHYNFDDKIESETINAKKISNRIFLIHDRDEKKQKRHDHLRHQLQENYYELPVLEIENLLSPTILEKTLQTFSIADQTILFQVNHGDYKMKPLGRVIEKHVKSGLKKIFSPGNKNQTPRLYNKLNFAQAATATLTNWIDLSIEAQALTRSIYNFIKKNNFS